nr:hypothetical protein [Pandoravirus aubagnensis]
MSDNDAKGSGFDLLPDELVAIVLWAVGPSWRIATRSVCHRWAAIVHQLSRTQRTHLARCRPALAEPTSWEAGRVLCASGLARTLADLAARMRTKSSPPTMSMAVVVADIAAWCTKGFAPPVPSVDMACVLMATAQPAVMQHALRLIDSADSPAVHGRIMCTGALAAVCADCADAVKLLLEWSASVFGHHRTESACGDDSDPLLWLDRVWLWTARHNAGRVAVLLLETMSQGHRQTGVVAGRLAVAWFKGTWATAAGRIGARAVLEAHASAGAPLGCAIGQRLAISAAHAGNGYACAFGLEQAWLNTVPSPTDTKEEEEKEEEERDDSDRDKQDNGGDDHADMQGDRDMIIAGRVVTAAVVGRAPDAALDCLEALGLRGHPIALLEVSITHGHACGRGALALAMRWPRHATSPDGLAWTACAIGRAISRGHLARADEAVVVLRPFVADYDSAHRTRVDPWREVALDALVAGFTDRAPLDTLALLCALAVRIGLGDREVLTLALANGAQERRGALCNASWATIVEDSARMWSPWCRPVALDGRALSVLLKRLPLEHATVGSALVAWLDAAGLVSAVLP